MRSYWVHWGFTVISLYSVSVQCEAIKLSIYTNNNIENEIETVGGSKSDLDYEYDDTKTIHRWAIKSVNTGEDATNIDKVEEADVRLRAKRSSDNNVCLPKDLKTESATASMTHAFPTPESHQTYFDSISMIWTGTNNATRLIALTHVSAESSSSIFFSKPKPSSPEYTFTEPTGLDNLTVSTMDRNPGDNNHVIIIGRVTNTKLGNRVTKSCVSANAGLSFTCHDMLKSYMPAGTILFKDKMVMTMMRPGLLIHKFPVLVLSKDLGRSWTPIHHDVTAAVFQPNTDDAIIAMADVKTIPSFFGAISFGKRMKRISIKDLNAVTATELPGLAKTRVTGFQYSGNFLHVVAQDDDGHKVLKVSDDHGKTFSDTHLPATRSGQYINILHTADKLIFAHVTALIDMTSGTLYTSGQGGTFFTESLANHVQEDFYNVKSMHGVYLSTQKQADESLMTLITMDRGSEWKPIKVAGCNDNEANCTLQIYSKYIITEHRTITNGKVLALPPYSSENARGIIVVQGTLAAKIAFNPGTKRYHYSVQPNIFISGDGGYTWIMAPKMLTGAHHILIGDSGGVIQALPVDKPLKSVLFSVNEGSCWYELTLKQEDVLPKFVIKGTVAQPGQQSLKTGVVGHGMHPKTNQTTWQIIDVDFKKLITNKCDNVTDYQTWNDHPHCYLGVERTYKRVKRNSWCYQSSNAITAPISKNRCGCSRVDYECDYGFEKDKKTKNCVKIPKFSDKITYCLDNKIYQLLSSGYRKLPGDQCDASKASFAKAKKATSVKTNKPCDDGDPNTYMDMDAVRQRICGEASPSRSTSSSGLVAATVILTLISTILCVVLAAVYYRYRALRRQFDYSSFENNLWGSSTDSGSTGQVSNPKSESMKIAGADAGGRSYSRLQETGAESDVDILNT